MNAMKFATALLTLSALSGCGDLLKDKKKSDTSECKIGDPSCDCVREAYTNNPPKDIPNDGYDEMAPTSNASTGSSGSASTAKAQSEGDAPFNKTAQLSLQNIPAGSNTGVPAGDSKGPLNPKAPVINPCIHVTPPPPPPPPGCDEVRNIPTTGGARYEEDRAEPYYNPTRAIPNRCAADAESPKNVKAEGRSEALGVNWRVLPGLKNFADSKAACSAIGPNWQMASGDAVTRIFNETGFRSAVELNCGTAFWANDPGVNVQCRANWRGFTYIGQNKADPLPINQTFTARDSSGQSAINDVNSMICIEGRPKPTVSCRNSIDQLFRNNPSGVVDNATSLTWARVTVKTFTDTAQVETQCALGAAQGWRMPSKVEFEAALKSDLFNTVAYGGKDTTCPLAWYKSPDAAVKKSCVSFGTGTDGNPIWKTDAECTAANLDTPVPTATTNDFKASVPSSGAAVPPPVVNFNVLGICVKDKK